MLEKPLKSKRTKLDVEDISFNSECDTSPVMNELYLILQDYYQLYNYILFESGDGHVASTVTVCKEIFRFLDFQSELKLLLYFHVLCDNIYFPSLIVEKLPCMHMNRH